MNTSPPSTQHSCNMETFFLLGIILAAAGGSLAHAEEHEPSVHTLLLSDCSQYFVFQSMGVIYSHKKSAQPGPLTRIMCCSQSDRTRLSPEVLELSPTHVAPSYSIHPTTGDFYPAYNKPLAILDFLKHNDVAEDFLLVLDADMILRRPMIPQEMGASMGTPVSARYGYLKGVRNALAERHIPNVQPRNDTRGGEFGRRADQVGGFTLSHQADLRRVAPMWLKFTEDIREDPDAWNLTGDIYSSTPGSKPWISEMYGYVFACASANLWHKIDDTAMIYPEYLPAESPKLLHYGLHFSIPSTGYEFDKHWHKDFDALVCPPWASSGRGLLPHPPHPHEIPLMPKDPLRRFSDLLSVETVNTLNEAFCERHFQKCERTEELLENCKRVHDIAIALEDEFLKIESELPVCEDIHPSAACSEWAKAGECARNSAFMNENCMESCGMCKPSKLLKPRQLFNMANTLIEHDDLNGKSNHTLHRGVHHLHQRILFLEARCKGLVQDNQEAEKCFSAASKGIKYTLRHATNSTTDNFDPQHLSNIGTQKSQQSTPAADQADTYLMILSYWQEDNPNSLLAFCAWIVIVLVFLSILQARRIPRRKGRRLLDNQQVTNKQRIETMGNINSQYLWQMTNFDM